MVKEARKPGRRAIAREESEEREGIPEHRAGSKISAESQPVDAFPFRVPSRNRNIDWSFNIHLSYGCRVHLGCRHGNIKGSCNDRQITRGGQRERRGRNGGITRDPEGVEWKEDRLGGNGAGRGGRKGKKDRRRCLSPPTSYTSGSARFSILHTPPLLHPSAPFAPPRVPPSAALPRRLLSRC